VKTVELPSITGSYDNDSVQLYFPSDALISVSNRNIKLVSPHVFFCTVARVHCVAPKDLSRYLAGQAFQSRRLFATCPNT
jgi:hypothetical protein